ncbi:MAG TPA: RodZ domain-containing protein [bacterium]|nr:RodZ domain-containing protein [bacterium]
MTTPEVPHIGSDTAGIGAVLRAARAKRGLSLAEMRVRTKIDARYLTALEAERFRDLPPLPFARGFLRTYALELGLDPDPLVERLAAAVSAAPRTTDQAEEAPRRLDSAITPGRTPSPLRRAATTAAVVGSLVAAILAVFFIQQVREFNRQVPPESPPASQQPAPSAMPAPASPPAVSETPAAAPPPPEPAASPAEPEGITVDVQAVGRSWIRVQGEDGEIYEGMLTPGQTRRWQSTGPMTIRIGNAAAVVVTVNGKAVGTLGRHGQVVSRTFTKDVTP